MSENLIEHKNYHQKIIFWYQNLAMCDQFSANKMMIFMNIVPMTTFVPLHMWFLFLKIVSSLASFPDQIKLMKCGHVQPISFHKW